ncbi:MAG: helix-turn-helix transcriptional regulator [Candidatus Magasanikbacteria bacterium]|nr:helix-turn-helix transcriptional regulator [Candidatus Magasanikbacteria bacterium]MCA9389729.1 helix-turn-helix transcriptional regulator [Candidatus Magasanikbacteria bacterium]MCA9391544.1 helix-turn-helix transcriptional regulator [Candidatus Magasanikbacteria bacterium]USN52431.1 MAG: helix-turn-helix transcriptional regulator [Candidatus Nomurabacteria bacterium]HPF95726.1 helix-turn-helix domain-containing protein [bacterium]
MRQANPFQPPKCFQEGFKLLGDAWTLLIIRNLSDGGQRFCALQRKLNNVNPVTLTSRLKKMEKLDLIERQTETIDKNSVCYQLTDKGEEILPILLALETYAKKHFA